MRLVTRSDFDGLTCAVIISRHEDLDGVAIVHPQDITDGRLDIRPTDILANLPYDPRCAKWFDHHMYTATPAAPPVEFDGAFGDAPSCARLVYEHYGGAATMPEYEELVAETDRMDSADLTPDDVLWPRRYIRLGFTIDSRSGFGDFAEYFLRLVDLLVRRTPIEAVLEDRDVKRRCWLMEADDERFRAALRRHSRVDGNVVITDFRDLADVPIGNRFLVYALYPEVNVSVRLRWGPSRRFAVMLLGHSIFNRTCNSNLGELAARYGGGGHPGAASIPLMAEAEQETELIVAELKANG